jgi:hypothetical protein
MTRIEIGSQIMLLVDKIKALPRTRELSLAVTKLEEAMHWIVAETSANAFASTSSPSSHAEMNALLRKVIEKAFGALVSDGTKVHDSKAHP